MKKVLFFCFCACLGQLVFAQKQQTAVKNSAQLKDLEVILVTDDIPPTFPGGDKALEAFIYTRLALPDTEPSEMGKIYVSFMVEADGSISEIKVIKGLSEPYNQAVIKVFSEMPKWNPAKQGNKSVRVSMNYPVLINY